MGFGASNPVFGIWNLELFTRVRLQPIAQSGQGKGEQALDFGAVERCVGGAGWAEVVPAEDWLDARAELRPARGDKPADLPTRQPFPAGQMIEAGLVPRGQFPNGAGSNDALLGPTRSLAAQVKSSGTFLSWCITARQGDVQWVSSVR